MIWVGRDRCAQDRPPVTSKQAKAGAVLPVAPPVFHEKGI